jgi:hypothetical protein
MNILICKLYGMKEEEEDLEKSEITTCRIHAIMYVLYYIQAKFN